MCGNYALRKFAGISSHLHAMTWLKYLQTIKVDEFSVLGVEIDDILICPMKNSLNKYRT